MFPTTRRPVTTAQRRDLSDVGTRSFRVRLKLARTLAAGSNDLPVWSMVRRRLLSWLLLAPELRLGSHVRLDRSHPELGGRLILGRNVDIGPRVILDVCGGLVIDDDAVISMDALILTHDHEVSDGTTAWRQQQKHPHPLRISSDTWVGARATILGGVGYVARGAIIGASAVVTKPVPDLAVVVGNPARIIHHRGAPAESRDARWLD